MGSALLSCYEAQGSNRRALLLKIIILLFSLISFSALSEEEPEKMKVIYEVRGAAFFYELDGEYYGEVLVGRNGGNWTILFELNELEKNSYLNLGVDYFHDLDKKVASNIDEYSKRSIHGGLGGKARSALKEWRQSNPL